MKTVSVGSTVFGLGRMKICVPVCAKTAAEALSEIENIKQSPADVIEWRMDYFEESCTAALPDLLAAAGEMPLLCTLRTSAEGGEREITTAAYFALLGDLTKNGARFIDIELMQCKAAEEPARALIRALHEKDGAAVISYHNFEETPPRRELVELFEAMHGFEADLPKIAVMPRAARDVMVLLSAMTEAAAKGPLIGISMGEAGKMTRVRGGAFGSVMTFASCGKPSAPGQYDVYDLAQRLG